jgi:uncharacterized short protein YbdD (DUF466 family)
VSVGWLEFREHQTVQFPEEVSKTGREADKNCEDEPKQMQKLLMDFCRTMVGIKDPQDD